MSSRNTQIQKMRGYFFMGFPSPPTIRPLTRKSTSTNHLRSACHLFSLGLHQRVERCLTTKKWEAFLGREPLLQPPPPLEQKYKFEKNWSACHLFSVASGGRGTNSSIKKMRELFSRGISHATIHPLTWKNTSLRRNVNVKAAWTLRRHGYVLLST